MLKRWEGEGESKARGEASVHEGTCLGSSKSLANMKVTWRPQCGDSPSRRNKACSGAGVSRWLAQGLGRPQGKLESLGRDVQLSWPKSLMLAWESKAACKAPVTTHPSSSGADALAGSLRPSITSSLLLGQCWHPGSASSPEPPSTQCRLKC